MTEPIKKYKVYLEKDVLQAALERYEFMFDNFTNVYFCVSGGKDSSVMVQLAHMVAKKKKKKYSVLYIDLEAMFTETTKHVEELREAIKGTCENFYWMALPLVEENATSAFQPEFITWDESAKDRWIRELPEGSINIHNNIFDFYEGLMSFEDFVDEFSKWFHKKKGGNTACGIGIRTDESLRRFIAIISEGKPTFKDQKWTTKKYEGIYNAYPLYDWRVDDIWGAVFKLDLKYNHIYEMMYKNGVTVHQQRICQPVGSAQKASLDNFRVLEPATWELLLRRVNGVNFGAIYCRTSLLGNLTSMKPKELTWERYAVYLLESLGIYEPEIMARYYRKIKYYMKWHEHNDGIPYGKMAEEATRELPAWKHIARAIEKNDFFMGSLSFGPDKAGDDLLKKLREKHRNLVGEGTLPKATLRVLKNQGDDEARKLFEKKYGVNAK